ncbi:MAG: LysE family translocator [Devosiaceae bacterium]|nr:LysE family translocator [Devosiaceae bacterium]
MLNFIPDLSVIIVFALASVILAISPGPDMALFISRTINYGRSHGIASMLGATSGILVHTLLAAFGISLLLSIIPSAFLALKIVGAIYLLWLAIEAVRAGGSFNLIKKSNTKPKILKSYLLGLGINLTNPKVVLFFITFLPQFVSADDPYASGKIVFLAFEFLLIVIPIVICIILMAEMIGKALTRSILIQKILNWSFAGVFASFAIAILAIEGRVIK